MAQLRDSKTSEFIFEGTPLQAATLAKQLGFDEVMFDDVGEHFDPQAVLDAHAESLDNSPSAEFTAAVEATAELPDGAVQDATQALTDARALLDKD